MKRIIAAAVALAVLLPTIACLLPSSVPEVTHTVSSSEYKLWLERRAER